MEKVFVTTSWDDGHRLDVKLAHLLKKYGVKGTFYVSPHNREVQEHDRLSCDDIVALSQDEHFEIGAHTMTHPRLSRISEEEAREEIIQSKLFLEHVIKKPVISFCYPGGEYTNTHVKMIQEAGFSLGRTVARFSVSLNVFSLYELPTTVHAYRHWSDMVAIARFARFRPVLFFRYYLNWDELAIALFDHVALTGGVFHLWGHSWEVDARRDWERLERVLQHIHNTSHTIVHVTNGELCSYAR